jgi:hypothetical protein
MNHITTAVAMLAIAGLAAGCAQRSSGVVAKAVQTERLQCSDPVALQDSASILQRSAVIRAGAIVFPVESGKGGGGARVTGARLIVRPPEGVTVDAFTRALQCHGALALLGQADQWMLPNDPTWLPDAFVAIDVVPKGGNFEVNLSSDSVRDNLRLYYRARAFAKAARQPGTY